MTSENNNDSDRLERIERAVLLLGDRIEKQNERILELEKLSGHVATSASFAKEVNSVSPPPPPPSPAVPERKMPSSISLSEATANKNNLEENIGVAWFSRIGIAALVLGISFFLKYAFDNNWIGPVGRVLIGAFAGTLLLAFGEKYIRKYFTYGQIISGGGIAILYLSVFAAFDFYHLLTQIPAFFLMILVTGIGIALSLRYNAISLIIVAILGGFATPFLISTGQNNEIGLFSYVLILDLAILIVSIFKKWRELNLIGFVGTVITFSAWSAEFYRRDELFATMIFATLFFLTYSVSSLIYNLVKKEKSTGVEQALMLFSAVVYFGTSYALLNPDFHVFMGPFALLLSLYYFLWAYLIRNLTPDDENLYNFSALLTVGFITLTIPIQFEQKIVTMGWAIEAALLIILGLKVRRESLRNLGVFVFMLALGRLMIFDVSYANKDIFLLNKTAAIFIFVAIVSYIIAGAAWKFREVLEEDGKKFLSVRQWIGLFIIIANFLTIFIGSREISHYYDQKITQIRVEESSKARELRNSYGRSINNDPAVVSASYEQIKKLKNKSHDLK